MRKSVGGNLPPLAVFPNSGVFYPQGVVDPKNGLVVEFTLCSGVSQSWGKLPQVWLMGFIHSLFPKLELLSWG